MFMCGDWIVNDHGSFSQGQHTLSILMYLSGWRQDSLLFCSRREQSWGILAALWPCRRSTDYSEDHVDFTLSDGTDSAPNFTQWGQDFRHWRTVITYTHKALDCRCDGHLRYRSWGRLWLVQRCHSVLTKRWISNRFTRDEVSYIPIKRTIGRCYSALILSTWAIPTMLLVPVPPTTSSRESLCDRSWGRQRSGEAAWHREAVKHYSARGWWAAHTGLKNSEPTS